VNLLQKFRTTLFSENSVLFRHIGLTRAYDGQLLSRPILLFR